MDINLVKRKKHSVTVSGFESGSSPNLTTVHTVFDPALIWDVPDGTTAFIKFNFYETIDVDKIVLDFSGTSDLTDIKIETSIDNFNFETLSATFVPTDTFLTILYTEVKEAIFIKITVSNPSGLVFDDIRIHTVKELENTELLSHNFFTLHSGKNRENFPFFPDITRNILEMYEDFYRLDFKIFDSTIFANSSISKSVDSDGVTVTLTPNNIPLVTGAKYIWDFDELLLEADSDFDATNPNIIFSTSNTATQKYTYSQSVLHTPRLVLIAPIYVLEFTQTFTAP